MQKLAAVLSERRLLIGYESVAAMLDTSSDITPEEQRQHVADQLERYERGDAELLPEGVALDAVQAAYGLTMRELVAELLTTDEIAELVCGDEFLAAVVYRTLVEKHAGGGW